MPTCRTALRIAVATAVATLSVLYARHQWAAHRDFTPDFNQQPWAARVLLNGGDVYTNNLPGFVYLYPLPATIVAVPTAWVSVATARTVFVAISAFAFVLALTPERWSPLLALATPAYLSTLVQGQWTLLMVAASVYPWFGWVLAAKPNAGILTVAVMRDRITLMIALALSAALTMISFAVDPGWFPRWMVATQQAPANVPLIIRPWGWLLLGALPFWREPAARVVLGLAFVPITPSLRDALFLFACGRSWQEMVALAVCVLIGYGATPLDAPTYEALAASLSQSVIWFVGLPTIAVLAAHRLTSRHRACGRAAT